ncbi:tail fiber/spike domain-containing protein [Klebsiella michiganensis]|uniref:tail fiber/spike domain-containing protein n=1 Tax=Klebsiella michiganensis TaxID=1134687 RepID=UPI00211436F3|nr:hypothetical protein [Klebsiella michiganensis]
MPATPQDRLYGLTTSVAVKPPVYISADYDITRFGEQTITSKTPTDERTITTTEGIRVLLLGQDNPVENGIWVARRSFWVRATDFNGPRDAVNGTLVFSINGDCWQVEADDPVVIGKSAIHFRPTYPFEANLDIFQRTLRVPEASVSVLPSAEDRAWKGLGFDGAGQPKLQDPAGTGLWGYVPAIGSFEKGSLLTQRFEVLLWESTDEYWRWDGAMPKIVLPGSTPDTAGGRGKGKWLDVTDATLRANLSSGDGFKWVGQVRSAAALSALPGSEGDRVLLLGYRDGWAATNSELSGGGEFIYVSELAGENNGVTIFNGWVRKFTRPVLTTFDAGLSPGEGNDHFAQIQTVLDVIPDGFTFEIHGEHRLSSQLIMEVKRNITIVGAAAKLTTKPYKSTIKVVRLASDGITYMGGILSAINCPGLRLDGDLEIEGTRMYPNVLRSDQTAAGEEHGLHFRYCDDLYIGKDIYVHDVFGYGALGIYCNRAFADWSLFTDTVRESGLNLFGGSVGGRAVGVRTRRTALYGVEIEDTWYGGARDIKVTNCDVEDAFWGIPTINNCSDVEVSGCNIRRARFGAQALQSSAGAFDTRNIHYHGNTYTGCPVGFRTAHPRNVSIIRETIDQSEVMAYGYTYPFNNLLFVDAADRRIFWGPTSSRFLTMVGQTVYIDDVAYTITAAAADATKTGYWKDFATDPDSLVKVTLDKALPENTDIQTVKSKDWGTAVRGMITEGRSVNLTIWKNDLTGDSLASVGIYHNSYNMDGVNTVNESVRGNIFRSHGIWLRMNDAVNTRDVSGNEHDDGSQLGISAANVTAAVLSQIKMGNSIRVSLPARPSVSATSVRKYFYSNQRCWAVGVRISFTDFSGTGELRVAIDGTQTHSTTSYSTGTAVVEIYGVANFSKGNHQIAINTSGNDIVFTSCDIELLIP